MATKTAYQIQADKRTKAALKLRARFDAKARKYATALVAALAGAADARSRLDRINSLYGVDISTETLLVHALRTAELSDMLTAATGGSLAGEEVQVFNPTANGNGGGGLATEPLFGEAVTAVANLPSGSEALPVRSYDTTLSGPEQDGDGVTLAAATGDTLQFNALASGGAAPAAMDIYLGGAQVASVAYLDRYAGQPFRFTHAGVAHAGSFAATVNF